MLLVNGMGGICKTEVKCARQRKQLKAMEFREQVLDKIHPSLATSYNNLSQIYKALGQLDRARTYAQKAVDIMTYLFPHGHPNLDIARKNLEGLPR